MNELEKAADALRRMEQGNKKLNDWRNISAAQRKRWMAKADVVIDTWREARGPHEVPK